MTTKRTGSRSRGISLMYKATYCSIIFFMSIALATSATDQIAKTPIYPGERIFEPFYSPTLTHFEKWTKSEGEDGKFNLVNTYGMHFDLVSTTDKQKVQASFERDYANLNCEGQDNVVVVIYGGSGAELTLFATTDAGESSAAISCIDKGENTPYELVLPLNGAKEIKRLKLIAASPEAKKGNWSGYIYYMALRNNQDYGAYLRYLDNLGDVEWDKLMQPDSYTPLFKPQYGLWFKDDKELEDFRQCCKDSGIYNYWDEHAKKISAIKIEKLFSKQIMCFPCDVQHRKESGLPTDSRIFSYAGQMAAAAIISQNRDSLRQVAKLGVVMASADFWEKLGPLTNMAGASEIDKLSFENSYTLTALALILDFAGEMLTPVGRDYIVRCMAKKGIANVNYSAWVYPTFYVSNQGAIFNNGRIASYLILEKMGHKHVKPYTDLAMTELNESMNNVFRDDGGNMESTHYMMWTMGSAIPSYSMYAQSRGKNLSDVLPQNILGSHTWAEEIVSTMQKEKRCVVTIGASSEREGWTFLPQVSAFMGTLLPASQWVTIFNEYPGKKDALKSGYWFEEVFYAWKYAQNMPDTNPKHNVFIQTKSNGLVVSNRELENEKIKLLVCGASKDVGKRHCDIGSFVLEFAGDQFFMDPPTYSSYNSYSFFHNVLTPVSAEHIPDYNPSPFLRRNEDAVLLVPEANGDEKSFHAKMSNIEKMWGDNYFKKMTRTIDSPTPDKILITDEYELGDKADSVNFNLQTYLPVKITDNTIVVTGEYGGIVEIGFPNECQASVEEYNLSCVGKCNRIIIHKQGKQGKLVLSMKLMKRL